MAITKRSPALHIVTAIVTILLLMVFLTVFSVGIFADDKTGEVGGNAPEDIPDDVTTRGIHYFQPVESIENIEEGGSDFYIVVFDAGTTGTRAHLFHFGRKPEDNTAVLLSDDVYMTSTALLTDSASDPEEAAKQSLRGLVNHLLNAIPETYQTSTQVLFQGTESLRELQGQEREKLIQAAYDYLHTTSLLVNTYDETFGVLDGSEEGLYQWMTINYVNGVFESTNTSHSGYAVIGIGGGSVQLVFQPTESKTKNELLSKQITTVDLFHRSIHLFTQSYSGLGRVESRLGILQTEERIRSGLLHYPELSSAVIEVLGNGKHSADPDTLFSVCLPPGYKGEITVGSFAQDVAAITLSHPHNIHNICTVLITVSLETVDDRPKLHYAEVNKQELYVLDRSLAHFIPKRKASESTISLEDIDAAAKRVCRNPKISEPFACIDLIYVYTLLQHGFGLSPDKNVHIDTPVPLSDALSWALGFAVDWLQKYS